MTKPTPYPHINTLLDMLLSHMQTILLDKLVGLYLYGSLVAGDYDDDMSDVDLLAAVSDEMSQAEFDALDTMQNNLVLAHPQRKDRLEIAYLSLYALKTFPTEISTIAVISPGEPFHFKEAGRDYLVNWYVVREKGLTLYGPPPATIIAPVSKDDFIQVVKEHLTYWREWIQQDSQWLPAQAYAILTMCRALYTCAHGEQLSKIQAAAWAKQAYPQWAALIDRALLWRRSWRELDMNVSAPLDDTRQFVNFTINQILR